MQRDFNAIVKLFTATSKWTKTESLFTVMATTGTTEKTSPQFNSIFVCLSSKCFRASDDDESYDVGALMSVNSVVHCHTFRLRFWIQENLMSRRLLSIIWLDIFVKFNRLDDSLNVWHCHYLSANFDALKCESVSHANKLLHAMTISFEWVNFHCSTTHQTVSASFG